MVMATFHMFRYGFLSALYSAFLLTIHQASMQIRDKKIIFKKSERSKTPLMVLVKI